MWVGFGVLSARTTMSVWNPFSSESVRRWPIMRQCSCTYGRVIIKTLRACCPRCWLDSVSLFVSSNVIRWLYAVLHISLRLVRSCFPLFSCRCRVLDSYGCFRLLCCEWCGVPARILLLAHVFKRLALHGQITLVSLRCSFIYVS